MRFLTYLMLSAVFLLGSLSVNTFAGHACGDNCTHDHENDSIIENPLAHYWEMDSTQYRMEIQGTDTVLIYIFQTVEPRSSLPEEGNASTSGREEYSSGISGRSENGYNQMGETNIQSLTSGIDNLSRYPTGIDKSKSVGEIPIQYAQSPTGAVTYQVPVEIYSGRKGFQPQLTIAYNSQSGNGLIGQGWNIGGISAIRATNKSIYYDGNSSSVTMNKEDAYTLDGIRLIKLSEGAGKIHYETEQGLIKAEAYISGSVIICFKVFYPNGNQAIFGYTDNTSSQLSYPLTEINDILGNFITYTYDYIHNDYYLNTIFYGGFSSTLKDEPHFASVKFNYTSREDNSTQYIAGKTFLKNRILQNILVFHGQEMLREYSFVYEQREVSLLKEIHCSAGGVFLNPLRFTYGHGDLAASLDKYMDKELRTYFENTSVPGLVLSRGKFDHYLMGDGLIAYPDIPVYGIKATNGPYVKFGSKYDAIQKLLVYRNMNTYRVNPDIIYAEEGFQQLTAMDVNGDGTEELVRVNSTVGSGTEYLLFSVYDKNMAVSYYSFPSNPAIKDGPFYSPYSRLYCQGDFNGDGKTEILAINYCKTAWDTDRNSEAILIDLDNKSILYRAICFNLYLYDRISAMDIDGDGKMEIAHFHQGGINFYKFRTNGSTYSLEPCGSTNAFSKSSFIYRKCLFGDFNGDGTTDILQSPSETYPWYKCMPVPFDLPSVCLECGHLNESDPFTHCHLCMAPLYCEDHEFVHDNGKTWTYYYSKGDGSMQVERADIVHNWRDSKFITQDIDNNGFPDLLVNKEGVISVFLNFNGKINSQPDPITISVDPNAHFISADLSRFVPGQVLSIIDDHVTPIGYSKHNGQEKMISRMENSLGLVNLHTYGIMNGLDSPYSYSSTSIYPHITYNGPMNLAWHTYSYLNGQLVGLQSYGYEKAVIHLQGLGFRGFEKLETTDMLRMKTNTHTFDPYNFGILKKEKNSLAETTMEYGIQVAANKKASVKMTKKISKDLLKNTTLTEEYYHDGYNNPVWINSSFENGLTTQTTINYDNFNTSTKYLIGQQRDASTLQYRNGSSWNNYSEISYDSNHLPVSKISQVDGNKTDETRWTYDEYGNVLSEKSAPYNTSTFLGKTYTYDARHHLLQTETDALGLATTWLERNKFGQPLRVQDHKGNISTFVYDHFGRETSVIRPDGTSTSTTMEWYQVPADFPETNPFNPEMELSESLSGNGTISACRSIALKKGFSYRADANNRLRLKTDPNSCSLLQERASAYVVTQTTTGKPAVKTYYDAINREIRSSEERFDGIFLHTDTRYDYRGNVSEKSMPYKSGSQPLWNTYQYDGYDRMTTIRYASGKQDLVSYNGNSTTSTINGISTTKTYDVTGMLVTVSDPGGTITYNYRADGQPVSVVAPGGVTTSFEYDNYGRKTKIIDPSAGTKQYVYDAAGNIRKETDANGDSIVMAYDAFYRLVSKTGKEFSTTYNYNTDGSLESEVSSNNTAKYFTYDHLGRVSTEKETVGNKWFRKSYTYGTGNLASLAYSSDLSGDIATENYIYTRGILTEIRLNNQTSIWKLEEENSRGQATRVTTGSINRNYAYDAYGLPTGRSAGSSTSGLFFNQSYNFNPQTGNLNWRQDNTRNIREDFTYDNLNRLTGFGGNTMAYDNKGNITDHSLTGSYLYNHPSKPYAVTDITPYGNGIPLREQTVTYTSFMRPASLAENNYSATFSYNASGDRVSMQTKQHNSIKQTRYYLGSEYEVDNSPGGNIERLYLGGDAYSAPAVYIRTNTGNWNIYYICRDYLGSITQVTSGSGPVVQELSYDPWGRLRNSENQQVYAPGSEPTLLLARGYTGHEHLAVFGLINMNARLYDPVLGRFLSPDPYVQVPEFGQNFNRYSYCLNNPLIYTDPTGEFFFLIPNIGWSKSGGFSIGLTVIVGIPGIISVQGGVGYSFKSNDFSATVGATAAFNTVYASYSAQSGFSTGWSAGLSPQMGFPISTNFLSTGVNYNITHNSWSGNVSAWSVDKNGWTFNPSVSVMIYPEHTTNLIRGQGFRNNEKVFQNFVANRQQQKALEYFGFKGTYNPKETAGVPAITDPTTGAIFYGDYPFDDNFDRLAFIAYHEMKHRANVLSGKYNGVVIDSVVEGLEEWNTYLYNYKNQGLYRKHGFDIVSRINSYGIQGLIYDQYTPLFSSKWWHFIYKIPRKW